MPPRCLDPDCKNEVDGLSNYCYLHSPLEDLRQWRMAEEEAVSEEAAAEEAAAEEAPADEEPWENASESDELFE